MDLFNIDGYILGMTDSYMPMKINGYAQGIQLLEIFCVTKSIASLFAVFGMLTPVPFDRGKMVSCQSMFPSCRLITDSIKALSSRPCAPVPISMQSMVIA